MDWSYLFLGAGMLILIYIGSDNDPKHSVNLDLWAGATLFAIFCFIIRVGMEFF